MPLVWVNVYRAEYIDLSNVFNTVLEQRIERTPRTHSSPDWFALANSPKPARAPQPMACTPTTKGVHVLALLVLQALQRLWPKR